MTEITSVSEDDLTNTVLYFTAPWCNPCKVVGPLMEQLSEEFTDLRFLKISVDNAPEVAQEYGIQSIPTIKLFINGTEKKSFHGLQPKRNFEDAFSEYSSV